MWLIGIGVSLIVLVPFAYAFLDGFKNTGEVIGSAKLLPDHWKFENYLSILGSCPYEVPRP